MTISWDRPVELYFADSNKVTVNGPKEALDYLLAMWPTEQGDVYLNSKNACMEAIEGVVPVEQARQAFVAAAEKAGIASRP